MNTALELALHTGAGLQQRNIEVQQADVAQFFRHIPGSDLQRQRFRNRRFTDTGLAHENGIVLTTACKNINELAQFIVAPNHRIDLAVPGIGGHVLGVKAQKIVLAGGWRCTRRRGRNAVPGGLFNGTAKALESRAIHRLQRRKSGADERAERGFLVHRQKQVAERHAVAPGLQRSKNPCLAARRQNVLGERQGLAVANHGLFKAAADFCLQHRKWNF
ncbi:hypothetical protein D3C72_1125380 [compost metagenome]